jgi:hypothetical protein
VSASKQGADNYTKWTGHSFTEGGTVVMWPVCEPDPMETISTNVSMGERGPDYVRGPSPIKTAVFKHHADLIADDILSDVDRLIIAIAEQTKALTALAESNQNIVDAMLQSEGVDPESSPYQTLD